jgi:hypothetical protein
MGRVVVMTGLSGNTATVFSKIIQKNLHKQLVADAIADVRLNDTISQGDNVKIAYFGGATYAGISAQVYTPGTPLSATPLQYTYDNVAISAFKHASFYIDDPRHLQENVKEITHAMEDAAYHIKDKIDTAVLGKVYLGYATNTNDLLGGTAGRAISATSANVMQVLVAARQKLRENNVEEMGDWVVVATPKFISHIEKKATSVGYNTADSALKNGYVDQIEGFSLYVSNNIATGACSAAVGGNAGALSAQRATCKYLYFGRKNQITLVMKEPTVQINKCDDKIGYNVITWSVYGTQVTKRAGYRFLCIPCHTNYA